MDERITLDDAIRSYDEVFALHKIGIRDFRRVYANGLLEDEWTDEIRGMTFDFKMPDLPLLISNVYPHYHTDIMNYGMVPEHSYDIAFAGIAQGLDDIAQMCMGFMAEGISSIPHTIYTSLREVYPDPNDFIKDYGSFKAMQDEYDDRKPGIYWLSHMLLYSYNKLYVNPLKNAKKFIETLKKEGDFQSTRQMQVMVDRKLKEYYNPPA